MTFSLLNQLHLLTLFKAEPHEQFSRPEMRRPQCNCCGYISHELQSDVFGECIKRCWAFAVIHNLMSMKHTYSEDFCCPMIQRQLRWVFLRQSAAEHPGDFGLIVDRLHSRRSQELCYHSCSLEAVLLFDDGHALASLNQVVGFNEI